MKKLVLVILVWISRSNVLKQQLEVKLVLICLQQTLAEQTLQGAILGGVSLDGVILCNTTMPDGTINNKSCKN
jgi:hypothetical protein